MKNRISPYESRDVSVISRRETEICSLAQHDYEHTELYAFRDKLRAALAKQAMDNTAILAMAEEHYIRIAPNGRAEYRLIVEAYARKALEKIVGDDW